MNLKSYFFFFVEGYCNEVMQNMLLCLKKVVFDDKVCVVEILSYNFCMERVIVSIFVIWCFICKVVYYKIFIIIF